MKNSEHPAFPKPHQNMDGSIQHDVHNGLTKREYFAAMAMQGLLAANAEYYHGNIPIPVNKSIAISSIEFADELLKQLEA